MKSDTGPSVSVVDAANDPVLTGSTATSEQILSTLQQPVLSVDNQGCVVYFNQDILELSVTPLFHKGLPTGHSVSLITLPAEMVQEEKEGPDNQDTLTGLLNRHGLEKLMDTLILDASSSSRTHAFLMLDMDQFKLINDLSGHRAGDILLQQIGTQLVEAVHEGDRVARLGGDEFGILLSNVEASEAATVARRMLATVQSMQFTWDGRIYPLTASIGIVPITENTRQSKLAMSQADTALYAAKEAGRNRLHIYSRNDEAILRSNSEMEWAEKISQAMEKNLFRLAAQPIKPLTDDESGDHYEVLIRLQRGDEVVAPGEFLPAAERFGLMGKIDRWVVKAYLDYLEQQPEAAERLTLCSLNLSGASMADADFLGFLKEQISRPHVQPEKLCFEVTETVAITNLTHARRFIEEIHTHGCSFSLDDFGSGMSSFGYLRQLPVDFLKIDGIFVRDLESDPVHRAMVKAINEVGHAMGKKTIAEFVVNQQIIDLLKEMGVDYAQGYFISEPQLLPTYA